MKTKIIKLQAELIELMIRTMNEQNIDLSMGIIRRIKDINELIDQEISDLARLKNDY